MFFCLTPTLKLREMSSPHISFVDMDIFDEPTNMESTFCDQVSYQQYEEEIRSETDKALGELCFYLDQNPEAYAKVLRLRKKEEVESAGIISFVKSKMLNLLQGEYYQEQLVSTDECLRQVELLKTGMCKTFQYSQDVNGNATRHSERLLAKRKAMHDESVKTNGKRRRINKRKKAVENGQDSVHVEEQGNAQAANLVSMTEENSSCIQNAEKISQEATFPQAEEGTKVAGDCDHQESDHCLTVGYQQPPPPPPPLPTYIPECFISCQRLAVSPPGNNENRPMSIDDMSLLQKRKHILSPRASSIPRFEARGSNYGSVENLTALSFGSMESLGSEHFVTPSETTSVPRNTKRLRSSASNASTPKSSFGNLQSELLLSNPIKRLKATPISRSPGLTPLKLKQETTPTEPLHKALHVAMKRKFKNVNTPSPKSDRSSMNSSFS